MSYLSRALHCTDTDLLAALATLGLFLPAAGGEKAPVVDLEGHSYWLNRDGRGGVWINARETRRMRQDNRPDEAAKETTPEAAPAEMPVVVAITPLDGQNQAPSSEVHAVAVAAASTALETEKAPAPAVAEPASVALSPVQAPPSADISPLTALRGLLKEGRSNTFALELGELASLSGKNPEDLKAILSASGLKIPEKSREKFVYVEFASEQFWLSLNAKGELWLNARQASDEKTEGSDKKSQRRSSPRGRKKTKDE